MKKLPFSPSLTTIVFSLFFLSQLSYGQDETMIYNKASAPSNKGAATLDMNPSSNVDLYTGKLQAGLPIFTLTSADVQIPIALAYTAGGGVRPSDRNTCVGMNWSLNAGGSISRQMRGLPDEAINGYIGNIDPNCYPLTSTVGSSSNAGVLAVSVFNNNYASYTTGFNNVQKAATGVPSSSFYDGEPDVFYIQTPSFSVRFTIDETGVPVFQNNMGLKITHSLYKNSANAASTGFVVTDNQGTQYFFGSTSSSREQTSTKLFGLSYSFVSTWYLDKIVTYNSKDVVTLNYIPGQNYTLLNYTGSLDYTSVYAPYPTFPPTNPPISFTNFNDGRFVSWDTVTYSPKYVSQIVTKLGEADFSYTPNTDPIINGGNPLALTSITIKQSNGSSPNTTIKTFSLTYNDISSGVGPTYTQSQLTPDYWINYVRGRYRRLLNTISIAGNTTATSTPVVLYTLKYNQSSPLPEQNLFQNCDYWGFANSLAFNDNGTSNYHFWFSNPDITNVGRQPSYYSVGTNALYASIFALIEVDDIQGGALNISYEPNTYNTTVPQPALGNANGNNFIIGGMRVSKLQHTLQTGETLATAYNYNDASGNSTGQIYNDFYKRVSLMFGNSYNNYFGQGPDNLLTLTFSQSPYQYADDKGIFVGYSSVTTTSQNGGYQVDNFTNFSDFPDVISAPSSFQDANYNNSVGGYLGSQISSFSQRRGLEVSSMAYTQSGKKISETDNTYASLDAQPTQKEIGIQDNTWWLTGAFNQGENMCGVNIYNSNIENYRLTKTVKTDYDQLNPTTSWLSVTTNYTYAADEMAVKTLSSTNSKGQTKQKTYYYADDNPSGIIPMTTTQEQQAITTMLAANRTNVVIHETDNNNGATHDIHNSYSTAGNGNVYLANTATYVGGSTQAQQQQFFNFDPTTSNMISSNMVGGKSTSYFYGYNSALPIAKVDNASSTATTSTSTTWFNSPLFLPANGSSVSATFTNLYAGDNIVITYQGLGTLANYSLTGPGINMTGQFYYTGNMTFPNMPAGSYQLTINIASGTAFSGTPYAQYGYSGNISQTNEFFYEGFEQIGNVTTSAHTGNSSYSGSYNVNFVPPNNRSYVIQYWTLTNGVWVFTESPYTGITNLSGQIDDVRIFPTDAQMTSYTYSPMVGKTGETDPSGRTTTNEYDGLGRINIVRDNDKNILSKKCYNYAGQSINCPLNQ